MKIYEINRGIDEILTEMNKQAEANEGVYEDYLDQTLETLGLELESKRESWLLWIKNRDSLALALKKEEGQLRERRQAIEREIERSKNWYGNFFPEEKFETAKVKLSYRKSEGLKVLDELAIPANYFIEKSICTLDKITLKNDIKAGKKIEGAIIETRSNMSIK